MTKEMLMKEITSLMKESKDLELLNLIYLLLLKGKFKF